jgi:phosphopantetheinyl transferase
MIAFLDQCAARYGFCWAVQSIDQVRQELEAQGEDYAQSILSETERALYGRFVIAKRKVEWLAGRIACKMAFARHDISLAHSGGQRAISVLSDEARAPYILGYPSLTLSLSHAHAYAVAVLADFAIGVDVEKIEPRPPALARYFCCPQEQRFLEGHGRDPGQQEAAMTLFWTRKEAVAKFLRIGGRLDFRCVNGLHDEVVLKGLYPRGIRLLSDQSDGYCVSLAM